MNILFYKIVRRCAVLGNRTFYFLLSALVSTGFCQVAIISIESRQFARLATVCAPLLAVLFAFSALLYNRGRALPGGTEQRRSLYAAERALQAAMIFLIGIALGAIGAATDAVSLMMNGGGRAFNWWSLSGLVFLGAVLCILYSYTTFFFAVRTIAHRLFRWLPTRTIIRRLR